MALQNQICEQLGPLVSISAFAGHHSTGASAALNDVSHPSNVACLPLGSVAGLTGSARIQIDSVRLQRICTCMQQGPLMVI